ncbi:MAG TPA: glycosyltransferase [Pyrinomonadaceae bacterium]|nr:glycosyltransferase [Pyrinomonadaceae bacterium]
MNARPLVSICIPTHNGEKWIEESIRSALSQTYQPLKILVVDDRSTDNTVELVRSFKDERVRFVVNERKRGLAGNWNACVRLAEGDFVKFLFQDDTLYPDCTEKMMQLMSAHPSLGLVFTRRELVVESDAPRELARELLTNYSDPHLRFAQIGEVNQAPDLFVQHLEKRLYQSCIAEPPSTLIRKEVFRRLGLFNIRMHQACDIEMWLRIMFFYDVGFVDEKLLIFRIHGKSATASNRLTRKAEYDRFWMFEGLLNHPEIAEAHAEITEWRADLLKRYRQSLIRPTAGWRSLGSREGFREAVRDAREMPRRIKFLREADEFRSARALHPRLESA